MGLTPQQRRWMKEHELSRKLKPDPDLARRQLMEAVASGKADMTEVEIDAVVDLIRSVADFDWKEFYAEENWPEKPEVEFDLDLALKQLSEPVPPEERVHRSPERIAGSLRFLAEIEEEVEGSESS